MSRIIAFLNEPVTVTQPRFWMWTMAVSLIVSALHGTIILVQDVVRFGATFFGGS